MMRMICKISLVVFLVAIATSFTSSEVRAQEHPAYLHALSDLRFARSLLERPNGGELRQQEKDAIHKIDDAIAEIKSASIDDGKGLADHEPVDAHLPWAGRLHKALEVLDEARHDCRKEEDNPHTRGLQMRVLHHIDEAHHHVEEAIPSPVRSGPSVTNIKDHGRGAAMSLKLQRRPNYFQSEIIVKLVAVPGIEPGFSG